MLTAFGLAVEIGDWTRFTGSTIGAYLGLVPSEHSSGASRSQGAITKTGNTHARRLLVEAAWHHRRPYNHASRDMRSRWDAADEASRVRGHQGNHRLHHKWEQFETRTNAGSSPTSPSPGNWPAGAGPWPPPSNRNTHGRMTRRGRSRPRRKARQRGGDPRHNYGQPANTGDARHS